MVFNRKFCELNFGDPLLVLILNQLSSFKKLENTIVIDWTFLSIFENNILNN